MDEPVLMKHYTVAVYILSICMRKWGNGPKYFKGENCRESV